jgi:DNA polymerase III subunit epsilon
MFMSRLREVVLDTETTGTNATSGDRIVEIGCVELINHMPTGNTYHTYLNPEYPVAEGAFRVHGLSNEFLSDKPLFAAVADEFLAFCAGSPLIIHNAPFDIGFLNAELARLKRPLFNLKDAVDTLILARRKHPGASNSLDALCTRYGIDNSRRTKHGALMDSEILAEVYLELLGGKQSSLGLSAKPLSKGGEREDKGTLHNTQGLARSVPLPERLSQDEKEQHQNFVNGLGEKAIWKTYIAS